MTKVAVAAVRADVRTRGEHVGHARMPRKPQLVCVLSVQSGRGYQHGGAAQFCAGHHHLNRDVAEALVRDGVLRWAGSCRVACYTEGREWKGVPSGAPDGPRVMQLV